MIVCRVRIAGNTHLVMMILLEKFLKWYTQLGDGVDFEPIEKIVYSDDCC